MYSAEDIANWFLGKDSMSPKKLQKLVYYAYAWYLAFNNEAGNNAEQRLFNNAIEAWVHGPVIPDLYYEYKEYSYHDIDSLKSHQVPRFDSDTEDVLEQVWEVYGNYNGNELESITHQEKPWIEAREGYGPLDRCNTRLDDNTIKDYYLERLING